MDRILEVSTALGISDDYVEPYGHYMAKVSLSYLAELPENPNSKLVLVTAISPTPPGEGKTTTSVGLGDGLRSIGKKTMICLREPSLGPVFGMKGGAAGGGYAQIVPMEDINLHFTGDFSAIALANNLLAALIDNHIHHGNLLDIDVRRITWKRVVDLNDRALRDITVSLGGPGNGFPRQNGFDIVVASEIMAIFCLATSLEDLKERLGRIVIGYTRGREPVRAMDLNAHSAMTVLLKNALAPNLVQTLENTPAFVHRGPFANIAHGCNCVIATTSAMKLANYVATVRALKYHGGHGLKTITEEDLATLDAGLVNHERHIRNVQEVYRLPCVVSINRFDSDTAAEIELLRDRVNGLGTEVVLASHWADGGAGAADLARVVVELCERPSAMSFVYEDSDSLWQKVTAIATRVYGASEVTADAKIRQQINELEEQGYGHYPVCIAKTQYSFSTDPSLRGAPSNHSINIREVRLAAGAEFIVMACGDIMTMPGLPKVPSSERIDLVGGQVVGLF